MESGSTDDVQIHTFSIIVQRLQSWSGASDADPRKRMGIAIAMGDKWLARQIPMFAQPRSTPQKASDPWGM